MYYSVWNSHGAKIQPTHIDNEQWEYRLEAASSGRFYLKILDRDRMFEVNLSTFQLDNPVVVTLAYLTQ